MQDGDRKIPMHFGIKGQGHNGTLSTFGSDTITGVVFNVQISYIDAGWCEEDAYTFWGQRSRLQRNFVNTSVLTRYLE